MASLLNSALVDETGSASINLPVGSDRVLVAWVITRFAGSEGSNDYTPTYGGQQLTQLGTRIEAEEEFEMHYLLEADMPADGTNTFNTNSGQGSNQAFGVMILDGMSQGAPDDHVQQAETSDVFSSSVMLSAAAASSVIVSAVSAGKTSSFIDHTSPAGATEEWDAAVQFGDQQFAGAYWTGIESGDATVKAESADGTSIQTWGHHAAVWAPTGGGSEKTGKARVEFNF